MQPRDEKVPFDLVEHLATIVAMREDKPAQINYLRDTLRRSLTRSEYLTP